MCVSTVFIFMIQWAADDAQFLDIKFLYFISLLSLFYLGLKIIYGWY